ncbi:G-protein coupled receptor GRL101-like [Antedon mediterranea]|uniref:G-protein coupled receptor GRL101-like n=1 Tax=Antedon mediterranea TaxID=105859 RepID=UPI003AF76749
MRWIVSSPNNVTIMKMRYLYDNDITTIEQGAFSSFASSLLQLWIQNNGLKNYKDSTFESLINLNQLYSDFPRICCLVGDIEICEPTDVFASCKDLLKREVLRVLMFLIGISSVIGNVIVIISRCYEKDDNTGNINSSAKKVQTTLITNLAVSDLLMAIYLITIASADVYYRGRYWVVAKDWKDSFLCSFSGAVSTLSGECSVFTLMVMSVDRAVNIVNPFSTRRLNRKYCRILIGIAWLVFFVLSFLPVVHKLNLIDIPYFGDNYYGKQSVCLALPLTRSRWPGWEYAVAIFVVFNGIGFIVIAVSYATIFFSVQRSGATVCRRRKRKEQLKMARKLGIIVFTDFCCWFPIILMSFCSEMGWWDIPEEIYVWAATFIIPINSSVNPYLFTIVYMCKCKHK